MSLQHPGSKHFLVFLFALFLSVLVVNAQTKKVLFVCTNVSVVNEVKNGTYLMEIAMPFKIFTENGFEVDIMSPLGGKIPIYHKGDTFAILRRIINDSVFIIKTSNSLKPEQVKTADYAGVYYPGGYGQFWDLPLISNIGDISAAIYEQGAALGSLGHGTASLVNIKLSSGEYLVKDKTLTCFPSWFEKEKMNDANYGKLLPFDMQENLDSRGAILKVCTKENPQSFLRVVDTENRIVTASFANDGEFVSLEMLKIMRNTVKKTGK